MRTPTPTPQQVRLRAVLIDHDGTLVDSEGVHARHWQELLADYGHTITLEEFKQRHAGIPTKANAATIIDRYALPIGVHELAGRKDSAVSEFLSSSPFPLMPGASEAVNALRAAGLRLAIVTAGDAAAAEATASKHFPAGTFETVVAGDDVLRAKPFPDGYRLAMERLGLDPHECIAIEDTPTGMQAALAAGLRCVVACPGGSRVTGAFAAATHVARSLPEAAHWLLSDASRVRATAPS